jgi:P27 family predicted phage terminase small subunit
VSANRAEPPGWLSDDARAVWDALPEAVVNDQPADAVVVYCCAVADFARAQQMLDQTGQLVRGARGGLVRSPLTIVKADNAQTIRHLARQLGLSDVPDRPDPPAGRSWRNQAATERSITALRRAGQLEEVDSAAVALARHLADALDRIDPARFPAQTASLARVQLAALRSLRGIDQDEPSGAGIDELLAALSAPVGDSPNS